MKKHILLLCFLLSLHFTKSIDDEVFDIGYDLLSKILRGMTKTGTTRCSEIFINNKEILSDTLKEIINNNKESPNIIDIISKIWNYGKLIFIQDLFDKCKLEKISYLQNKIFSKNGIIEMGTEIENNNEKIFGLIKEIVKGKDSDEKLTLVGRIISIVLNFYVE